MDLILSNEERNNEAVKWGVLMGIFAIAYLLTGYTMGAEVMVNKLYFLFSLLLPLLLLSFGIIKLRNKNQGFITFKNAFLFLLISSIVGILINLMSQYILFNIFDTDFQHEYRNALLAASEKWVEKSGISDIKKEEMREGIIAMQFDILSILKSYLNLLVGLTIVILIISAIVKRTPKEEII